MRTFTLLRQLFENIQSFSPAKVEALLAFSRLRRLSSYWLSISREHTLLGPASIQKFALKVFTKNVSLFFNRYQKDLKRIFVSLNREYRIFWRSVCATHMSRIVILFLLAFQPFLLAFQPLSINLFFSSLNSVFWNFFHFWCQKVLPKMCMTFFFCKYLVIRACRYSLVLPNLCRLCYYLLWNSWSVVDCITLGFLL